ncbi:unnamed protein product [Merluccius merluccius]
MSRFSVTLVISFSLPGCQVAARHHGKQEGCSRSISSANPDAALYVRRRYMRTPPPHGIERRSTAQSTTLLHASLIVQSAPRDWQRRTGDPAATPRYSQRAGDPASSAAAAAAAAGPPARSSSAAASVE